MASFNTFYGPDISTYQTITDWHALNGGAAFIMIKACGTDDGDYLDDKWDDNINNARIFGNALPRIAYIFCGGNDPIHDADYFVDNIGSTLQVGEVYEFDCERGNAVTPEYAKAALDHAKARLGWGGGVYVSQDRLITEDWSAVAQAGYFVHPANWAVSTSDTFSVGAFKTYAFQQYTKHATWPGIADPCDGNAFFGQSALDILKFGKPASPVSPPPVPMPTPIPPEQPATPPVIIIPPVKPVAPLPGPVDNPDGSTTIPVTVIPKLPTPGDVITPEPPVTPEPTPEEPAYLATISKAIAGGLVSAVVAFAARYGFFPDGKTLTALGVLSTLIAGYVVGHLVVFLAPANKTKA